jgi:hypothetical protein
LLRSLHSEARSKPFNAAPQDSSSEDHCLPRIPLATLRVMALHIACQQIDRRGFKGIKSSGSDSPQSVERCPILGNSLTPRLGDDGKALVLLASSCQKIGRSKRVIEAMNAFDL